MCKWKMQFSQIPSCFATADKRKREKFQRDEAQESVDAAFLHSCPSLVSLVSRLYAIPVDLSSECHSSKSKQNFWGDEDSKWGQGLG